MTASINNLQVFKPRYTLATFLLSCFVSSSLFADDTEKLQLGIHQVGSWHAANDSELILKDHQNTQYQATLKPPCKGLEQAKSIAFTSNGSSTLDQSSSVILPGGKRCPFQSFTRQVKTE